MNPDLLILCATDFEISHFLSLCPGDSKRSTRTGLTVLSGKFQKKKNDHKRCDPETHDPETYDPETYDPKTYDLVITGPGVFNAAHALTVYLESSSPGWILQTGIAGVFRQAGCAIGDVAIATREHYLHTGIQSASIESTPLPFDLIEKKPLTRKGIYPFDKKRVDHYHGILSQKVFKDKIRITKGPFITVSNITSCQTRANQVYKAFGPVMESMEGAASAHIAALYNIPMIEIRSASNFVGERDKAKWDMDLAVRHLGKVCVLG